MSKRILEGKRRKAIFAASILAIVALAGSSYVYASASGTSISGKISVSVIPDPLYASAVAITSGSCTIANDGLSFTCSSTIEYGKVSDLNVTLTNPESDQLVSVTPSFTSPNNVLTVLPYSTTAVSIATGASYTFILQFNATNTGSGSLAVSFT